jgi:hypothetical protein
VNGRRLLLSNEVVSLFAAQNTRTRFFDTKFGIIVRFGSRRGLENKVFCPVAWDIKVRLLGHSRDVRDKMCRAPLRRGARLGGSNVALCAAKFYNFFSRRAILLDRHSGRKERQLALVNANGLKRSKVDLDCAPEVKKHVMPSQGGELAVLLLPLP